MCWSAIPPAPTRPTRTFVIGPPAAGPGRGSSAVPDGRAGSRCLVRGEGPPGQRPIGGADRLRRGAEEELHEVGRMAAEVGERPAYCGAGVEEPLREPLPALAARDGAGVRETHPAIADLAQSAAGDDVADGLRVAESQ